MTIFSESAHHPWDPSPRGRPIPGKPKRPQEFHASPKQGRCCQLSGLSAHIHRGHHSAGPHTAHKVNRVSTLGGLTINIPAAGLAPCEVRREVGRGPHSSLFGRFSCATSESWQLETAGILSVGGCRGKETPRGWWGGKLTLSPKLPPHSRGGQRGDCRAAPAHGTSVTPPPCLASLLQALSTPKHQEGGQLGAQVQGQGVQAFPGIPAQGDARWWSGLSWSPL